MARNRFIHRCLIAISVQPDNTLLRNVRRRISRADGVNPGSSDWFTIPLIPIAAPNSAPPTHRCCGLSTRSHHFRHLLNILVNLTIATKPQDFEDGPQARKRWVRNEGRITFASSGILIAEVNSIRDHNEKSIIASWGLKIKTPI